jgi:hypothetical protein
MLLLPSPPETSKEEGEWWAFQFEKPQDYAHCISSLTALPGTSPERIYLPLVSPCARTVIDALPPMYGSFNVC